MSSPSSSNLTSSRSNSDSDNDSSSSSQDESDKLTESQRQMSQADDLVSVTVRKTSPTQKAGVSLVERQSKVFVSNITENGFFHQSGIEIGDVVLSINGKRLKKGEGAREIIQKISVAKSSVTMVVKKSNRKARRGVRSLSPTAQRRKKYSTKIHENAFGRNEDGSLKYDINPRLHNINIIKQDIGDDKPQIPIVANKLFAGQDIGLRFKDLDNRIFVSAVAVDSIFKGTDLELGDRVVGVCGMDFMSYGDSAYALQVAAKSTNEVSLVLEKDHTAFDKKRDTDPAHNTSWEGTSREDKEAPSTTSGRISITGDGDNLLKILELSGHLSTSSGSPRGSKPSAGRKGRKSKAGPPRKNTSVKGKNLPKKTKESPIKATPEAPVAPPDNNDSEESSMGDFAEAEKKAEKKATMMVQKGVPKSPSVHSLSRLNQSSNLARSVTFDFDSFVGDYLRVTVRKESEERSGISLEKSEGKFLLTAVPQHEKRIYPGMQVLAINGIVNLHTAVKAEDLISRSKGEVQLIIDFSSPLKANGNCPCCSQQKAPQAKVNGRRIVRRTVDDIKKGGGREAMSVAASENTTRVNNRAPPGKKAPKKNDPPPKYQFDEFDSDSEDEGQRNDLPSPTRRTSTSRYQANDKFMVRVSKTGKSDKPIGIRLFDHKGSIYVRCIDKGGLFYSTPISQGDKVLSVNGRKISSLKSAANVMSMIEDKDSVSIFVLRPDPNGVDVKEAISFFHNVR